MEKITCTVKYVKRQIRQRVRGSGTDDPAYKLSCSFTEFVRRVEPRLTKGLCASFGSEVGTEATAEAFAYAWEHWPRIRAMRRPDGYLWVVARNAARTMKMRPRARCPVPHPRRQPVVEPGLHMAMERLTERQRVAVVLAYGFEWTLSEVAEVLGVSKSTVQNHVERALRHLREDLGVALGFVSVGPGLQAN